MPYKSKSSYKQWKNYSVLRADMPNKAFQSPEAIEETDNIYWYGEPIQGSYETLPEEERKVFDALLESSKRPILNRLNKESASYRIPLQKQTSKIEVNILHRHNTLPINPNFESLTNYGEDPLALIKSNPIILDLLKKNNHYQSIENLLACTNVRLELQNKSSPITPPLKPPITNTPSNKNEQESAPSLEELIFGTDTTKPKNKINPTRRQKQPYYNPSKLSERKEVMINFIRYIDNFGGNADFKWITILEDSIGLESHLSVLLCFGLDIDEVLHLAIHVHIPKTQTWLAFLSKHESKTILSSALTEELLNSYIHVNFRFYFPCTCNFDSTT